MRAEQKVGLIVGLFVIAGGGIWWFSRPTSELAELPLDRRAMDAESTDDITLARDTVPVLPDVRSTDRSAQTPPDRERPSPVPARRATPVLPTPGQSDRAPQEPAAIPAEPEAATTPLDRSFATGRPGVSGADQAAREADGRKPGERPPTLESPSGKLTLPSRREPARAESRWPRRKTYVIQPGDRLIDIARQEYDDGQLWEAIRAANPGLDETRLQIGQEIEIPSRAEALHLAQRGPALEERTAAPRLKPGTDAAEVARATYVVGRGDTLIKIARNVLNDEKRWEEIFALNRDQLESPHLLRIGMELRLPAGGKKATPKKDDDQ